MLRSERTVKKTGATTTESRYYLSSLAARERSPEGWLKLIRGHWGGVENRNHWRRDALMGEDRSRSRNANLLANLALIRNALLERMAAHAPQLSLPEFRETVQSRPGKCLAIIAAP